MTITIIDQFRYIKIQLKTIGLSMRLWGINPTNSEPRTEVYCFWLNFNLSKLVYCGLFENGTGENSLISTIATLSGF